MKKILILSLGLLALLLSACKEQIDVPKETEAIISVLNGETQAWMDRNYDLLASYWVQDEFTRRVWAGKTGYDFNTWEVMSGNLKKNIENDSLWFDVEDMTAEKTDFNIKVYTNSAWATFTGKESWIYKGEPYTNELLQLCVLEKIEGTWKIAAFVAVETSSFKEPTETVTE